MVTINYLTRRDTQPEMDVVHPAENEGGFQLSTYQENILRPLRSFVIKSNLNKIIAFLFISWKLVRFYRYLIVLQEMHNAEGVFSGMEIHHSELMFKGKNERMGLFISVLRQMDFQASSVLCCIFREGKNVLLSTAACIQSNIQTLLSGSAQVLINTGCYQHVK